MGKVAIVFPGQGAQQSGMGKDIYKSSKSAKKVMDSLEQIRPGILELCFFGTNEQLKRTENSQPCLYVVALGVAAALKEQGLMADYYAGFSLGELCALAMGGVFSIEQGFRLVLKRAELMQKASESITCGMAAVLRISAQKAKEIASCHSGMYAVNFNAPTQTIIVYKEQDFDKLKQSVESAGGRVLKLNVSGGYHSPYMDSPAKEFRKYLESVSFSLPKTQVYSNYLAQPYPSDEKEIKDVLASQINSPVLWQTLINNMVACGVDTFVEAGVGSTLSGLINKINPKVKTVSIEDSLGLEKVKEFLAL